MITLAPLFQSGLFICEQGGDHIETILVQRPQKFAREPTRRIVQASSGRSTLSPYRSRISNLLTLLRATGEETRALELLVKQHPDVSTAARNYTRLANSGGEIVFEGVRGGVRNDLSKEWRNFASSCNPLSNAGLDGLVDQLHRSAVVFGAMGIESEPNDDLNDIVAVHVLDPRWYEWEKVNGRWRPFQYQMGSKVYIDSPNFIHIPSDPDFDDPRGTLMLSSSIFAIDTQLQALSDVAAVIHKVGYPREDIKILREPVMKLAQNMGKTSQDEIEAFMSHVIQLIRDEYTSLEPDSTFVHYDDIEPGMTKSANERGGVDVRAVNEFLDIFVLNGLGQMGVFANRTSGITETWGTVQFKIFIQTVESFRRGTKRIIEEVARHWLRLRGTQAIVTYTHNPIDWESEETRLKVKKLELEIWRGYQALGWVDGDEAAQHVVGHPAKGEPKEGAFRERRSSDSDDERDRQNAVSRTMPKLQVIGGLR